MNPPSSNPDQQFANELREAIGQSDPIEHALTTNDRVIARVTDGIYRQPGSAVRELIANAYDADATWVSVKTDAPKFSRMTVEDNGTGMTPEAVIHLLHNIGGSAKRTKQGKELGITSPTDSNISPSGRRLIGKLGIGIFSVSQLTHSFQIITKTAGDSHRTVVLVNLRQFADVPTTPEEGTFKAGSYQAWRERTDDTRAHGTTIILTAIRPQTRDSLRSEQLWGAITHSLSDESEAKARSSIPTYHIGHLDAHGLHIKDPKNQERSLPWDERDNAQATFAKMVKSVWESVGQSRSPEWHRVKRDAPFHAINIDLCGGFAGVEKSNGVPNYFAALQAILQHQMHSDEDFLLFITTRMDDDSVDDTAKEALIQLAQQIHDDCAAYASDFATAWSLQDSASPIRVADFVDTGEAFMLGLTQWIISRGVELGLKASVRSFMTYRVAPGVGDDDIVSLAIRFKPDPVVRPDPHGLVKVVNPPPTPAEKICAQSRTVPGRVNRRAKVDELLRAHAEEFERCIQASSELLGAAGYDANLYRDWVLQEHGESKAAAQ
ncbi:ATP-binding protein [Streptomyces sp. NPDC006678]|uniref:PP_RS20740 family protein n=1 Tax=Streptomyces sp. NPDC006678 TaxID=3157185 RepID=UPI0033C574C6